MVRGQIATLAPRRSALRREAGPASAWRRVPQAALMLFGVLVAALAGTGGARAEAADPAEIAQAGREIAARALTAPDGRPLCFLPPDTIEGMEAFVVSGYRAMGSDSGIGSQAYGTVDVTVEETDAPVLLILTAYEPVFWRVHLGAGARLGAVHVAGYDAPLITGVPEGVPLTWRFFDSVPEGEKQDCVFAESDPARLADPAYRRIVDNPVYFSRYPPYGPADQVIELVALEEHLGAYAGVPVVSYQRPENDSTFRKPVTVSQAAVERFEAIKREGAFVLASIPEPELPLLDADAPVLVVPEGLTRAEIATFILAAGYAEPTRPEVIDYVCAVDDAKVYAAGIRRPPRDRCNFDVYRPRGDGRGVSRTSITLLGPVRIIEGPCRPGGRFIFVPSGVSYEVVRRCKMPHRFLGIGSE